MPRLQPGQPRASVSWDDFMFGLHEKFRSEISMSRGNVFSLIQFDFIYCPAFILGNFAVLVCCATAK